MLPILQWMQLEFWILLGLGVLAIIVIRMQVTGDWENLRIETVHEIETKLQGVRRNLRMIMGRSRAPTDRRRKPSYTVNDFQRDLKRLRENEAAWGISPRVDDLFRGEVRHGWGVREITSEQALGYSNANPHSWDYWCRFVAVLSFLRTHRETFLATPEKIIAIDESTDATFPFRFNPQFLEFLLSGYDDPILPRQEGWHPLLSPWENSPYEATLLAFRRWLGKISSPASARQPS